MTGQKSRWRRWSRAVWRRITGISIRYKLLGMVLAAILLLGLAVTFQTQAELARDLRQSLEERGVALARDLSEDATDLILTQNIFGLNQEIRATLETNPDVRYVFILNPQGQVVAHSFPNRLPPDLLTANLLPPNQPWQAQILNSEEGLITDVVAPIFDGKLGVVRLGLSHNRLEAMVNEAARRLLFITLGALLVGGVTVLLLTRVLTRPIFDLVTAARAVGQGNLTLRPPVRMSDEVGELTAAFNTMTEDLVRSRDNLLRQNRQLTALNSVAQAISGGHSLEEVLDAALESVLPALGCSAGWVLLNYGDPPAPQIMAECGISNSFLKREAAPETEPCRCIKILQAKEDWQQPILRAECPRLQRAQAQNDPEARFDRHLSVPMVSHGRPLGILNLALTAGQSFSPEQVELAGAIGRQVGVAVDAELHRRRLVDELARREALRGQLLERVLAAQEEERRRIARELHDQYAQALTALSMGIEATERALREDQAPLKSQLDVVKELASHSLDRTYELIFDLRPTTLDDLGLAPAIRWYAENRLEPLGVSVHLETEGLRRRLSPQIETACYRVVQEALLNVAKHARNARVNIRLAVQNKHLCGEVADNGPGFDLASMQQFEVNGRGMGLLGMQERLALLGGQLHIDTAPGRGTRVSLEIPLENQENGVTN
ncbi:MAG: HAMP domain-containing protein [Chloroflexi bacterium]|nr:MAG: HAMP domain-containing protein [Chloroflexota bacterium]